MPKIGEVKVPNDKDLEALKQLCFDDEGWALEFTKKNTKVYVKTNELSSFKMVKAKVDFDDVPAITLFDVFMDTEYRREWDAFMVEGYDHCYITPNSDVGYYCGKSPKPFKNRDFVLQRSWLDYGHGMDKIITNHSVNHSKIPSVKSRVRGITYQTTCYIQHNSPKSCSLFYVTQSDPGGSLPIWLTNMATKVMAPKFVKKIHKASLKYDKWKGKNNATYKPWSNPEEIKIPKINMSEMIGFDMEEFKNTEDESNIKQSEVDSKDLEDD